jgi:hypothetical protein
MAKRHLAAAMFHKLDPGVSNLRLNRGIPYPCVCLPTYAAGLRPSARGFGVVVQAHGLNAFGQFARWKSTYKDRA